MQAVILAAGKGKRLKPITDTRSKAMAPVVGKPMVARVLENISFAGINDFIIVISPTDDKIKTYLTLHYPLVSFNFVVQKESLGMADAIKCAREYIKGPFLLSACDSLIDKEKFQEMVNVYDESRYSCVLATLKVQKEEVSKFGIVGFDSNRNIAQVVEKPSVEDALSDISSIAHYVFPKKLFDYIDMVKPSIRGEYELQDALQMLLETYGAAKEVRVPSRYNLTSPDDLFEINMAVMKSSGFKSYIPEEYKDLNFHEPVFIEDGAKIIDVLEIGPNVYVESGATIKDMKSIRDTLVIKEMIVGRGART